MKRLWERLICLFVGHDYIDIVSFETEIKVCLRCGKDSHG